LFSSELRAKHINRLAGGHLLKALLLLRGGVLS
jgi:hypothetical protein